MTDKKDYTYAGYSGYPFSDEELEIVPGVWKDVMIDVSKKRFEKNHRLVANAMIGACAILLGILRERNTSKK